MRLHSDWSYLDQEFGCSVRQQFLMAVRSLDNPRAVTPFLLESGGRRFGLFLHVERGNVEAARLPPDIEPVYYRPYFTFEPSGEPPPVHDGLSDAMGAVAADGEPIVVDRRLPIAIADSLAERFDVQEEPDGEAGTVTVRPVSRRDVVHALGRHRSEGADAARRLLSASDVRRSVEPYLQGGADRRFDALDACLEDAGLAALVVSSTLNVNEIGGVPVRAKRRPLAVLYRTGDTPWRHRNRTRPGRTAVSVRRVNVERPLLLRDHRGRGRTRGMLDPPARSVSTHARPGLRTTC